MTQEIILDSVESMYSSASLNLLKERKKKEGNNDLPKDGQRHFRKLSKELDRPTRYDSVDKVESEIITPTSKHRGSILSINQLKYESCNNSFTNSIGSERIVNIIEKENTITVKRLDLPLNDKFLD